MVELHGGLLHNNEEECIIPLKLLNYFKEDEYNKIDNYAKEKEKVLHTGYYSEAVKTTLSTSITLNKSV